MVNQDRQGRKRTLFRRTREQGDFDSPPLGALGDDQADEGWVDISANPQAQAALDAEQRSASPRKTASMFAPKEKWTETWGDDAWDDEWSDPTARRSSVPPAASPGPDQIDAWLSTDSESWGDVTRETIQKMGADPKVIDAPGATWDNDQRASLAPPLPQSDIEVAIEKALASVTAEVAPATSAPLRKDPPPDVSAPMLVVDSRLSNPKPSTPASTRFRRGATNLTPVLEATVATSVPVTTPLDSSAETRKDLLETVDLTIKAPAFGAVEEPPGDSEIGSEIDGEIDSETDSETDKAINKVLDATVGVVAPVEPHQPDSPASVLTTPVPAVNIPEPAASGGSEMVETTITTINARPDDVNSRAAAWATDTDATGELPTTVKEETPRSALQGERLHSFVDRMSWIGTGVALVAALRLIVLLWAGARSASPAEGLNLVERIGRGFGDAGVIQGLLLIVAVALLIAASVFANEERSSRIGTGLGIIIGASTLGVIGSLFAYLSDRRLGDLAGTATGSYTLRAMAALLTTAGMSIVAWAAAVRSLRSDS